ncbi:MAG: hypothetical protein JW987_13920 [Anaerolineaceae bacterium]|nr:hypothetical protein [Anaerolineaceae bacterium]
MSGDQEINQNTGENDQEGQQGAFMAKEVSNILTGQNTTHPGQRQSKAGAGVESCTGRKSSQRTQKGKIETFKKDGDVMNGDLNTIRLSAADSSGKWSLVVTFTLKEGAWNSSNFEVEQGEKALSVNVTKEEREMIDRIFKPFLLEAIEASRAGHLVESCTQ